MVEAAGHEDDLLVVGSASPGPAAREFLGDMTFRIPRAR